MNKNSNKNKDRLLNFKSLLKENKKISIALILLLFSIGLYFVVFSMDEDPYADNFGITILSRDTNVVTGTKPFDPNLDADENNNVVRNFDDVTYNFNYLITKKESANSSALSGLTLDRKVIADILIPSNVSVGKIITSMTDTVSEPKKVKINDINYNYYYVLVSSKYVDYRYSDASGDGDTLSITFNSINTKSDNFSPIISLREATDMSVQEPSDLGYSGVNMIPSDRQTLTVTGVENYKVKVFGGNISKDPSNTDLAEVPFGVMVYLPKSDTYGIKGIKIPETITYSISAAENDDSATLEYKDVEGSEGQVRTYSKDLKYMIGNMPYSPVDSKNASINGDAIINDGTVTITNFDFDGNTVFSKTGDYVLTTNAFLYGLNRNGSNNNFDITFSASISDSINDSISLTSSTENIIGDLTTRVRFVDESDYEHGTFTQSQVSPTYNIGENFYTRVTLNYVNTENTIGDTLTEGMDTYIKLDNSAMKLLYIDELNDIVNVTFGGINEYSNEDYEVSFGLGNWELNNFNSTSDSLCTTPITASSDISLSEKLMNLYGGPCLSDTSSISWKKSDEIIKTDEEDDLEKIMIVKVHFNKIYAGTRINIFLKSVVKNSAEIGDNYQLVVNSTTKKSGDTYYLTDEVNTNGKELMANSENYLKEITGSRTESPKQKYGNTILASIVKAKIDEIKAFSQDDVEKTQFVTGADEPVVWRIDSSAKVSSMSNVDIEKGRINVYVPEGLIYYIHDEKQTPINLVGGKGEKVYLNENNEEIDSSGTPYTKYIYEFGKEDIKNDGSLTQLKVYTNIMPNIASNSSLKIVATIDFDVSIISVNEDSTESRIPEKCVDPIKNRTKTSEITIINNRRISVSGLASPQLLNLNQSYDYNMITYNNYNKSSGSNLSLVNILPYNDKNNGTVHSIFAGSYSVKINSLPSGYTAYYSKVDSKSILMNEVNSPENNHWEQWTDPNSEMTGITAFKIVSASKISYRSYFGSQDGISATITPIKNSLGDEYLNKFYIFDNDENNYYESNDSLVSVYNRQISGLIFEDYNYNGLFDEEEKKMSDLSVELYKLSNVPSENFDEKNILDYISDNDELIDKTTTNENGRYRFRGLEEGYYYVAVSYDNSKYVVSDYEKVQNSKQNSSTINSKFFTNSKVLKAVSKVVHLSDQNIREEYINLGLRVRLQFGIVIDKYITNVKVISNKGVDNYDYDRAKQVKINLKNLKNTSIEVTYGFELKNSKYFPGYVGTIVDIMPEGMTFNSKLKENYNWTNNNGVLNYNGLTNTLITPNEKYNFKLVLTATGEEARSYLNVVAAGDTSLMSIINGVDYGSIDDISGLQDEEELEEGGGE